MKLLFEKNFVYRKEVQESLFLMNKVFPNWGEKNNIYFCSKHNAEHLGSCIFFLCEKTGNKTFLIELTVGLKKPIETIIHELLHVKNPNCNHSGQWEEDVKKLRSFTGIKIKIKGCKKELHKKYRK